jgi:peptidoglycan/LPS O-acetylase OafA/YrhL
MNPSSSHDRSIPTLDGWRAVAVLWVCSFHGRGMLFGPEGLFRCRPLDLIAVQGELGVEIFFGLSGFLITSRLLKERERDGRISLSAFYLRRAFRILPAAWLYLAVVAALLFAGMIPPLSQSEMTSSLFFWRNYGYPGRATGHFWSLAVEEHFYFLWPAVFLLVSDKVRLRRIALWSALGVAVWRFFDVKYQIAHALFPIIPTWDFRTDLRIDALLWGCIAALAFPELKAFLARLGPWKSQVLSIGAAAGFAGLRYLHVPLAEAGLAAAIPVMIVSTAVFPSTLLGRFLDLSLLRLIGRWSYSLYLWQQLFMYVWPPGHVHSGGYGSYALLMVAGTLLCTVASYYAIEQPMIALGRRLGRKRAA